MQTLTRIAVLGCVAFIIQGCSSFMATSGPASKDLSVLEPGTHRYAVLAELGQPIVSEKNDYGNKVDVFKFRQGTHGSIKAAKALGYGAAAFMTLGLSELIASPVEGSLNKGAEMQLKVGYNTDDLVNEIVVLRDGRWMPMQDLTEKDRARTEANRKNKTEDSGE